METLKDIVIYLVLIAIVLLVAFNLKIIITVLFRLYMFIIMAIFSSLFLYEMLKVPFDIFKELPSMITRARTSTFKDWIIGIIAFFWMVVTLVGIGYMFFWFFTSMVPAWF